MARLLPALCCALSSLPTTVTGLRRFELDGRTSVGNISVYLSHPLWRRWYAKETEEHSAVANLKPMAKHKTGDPQYHLIRIQKTGGTTFGERVMPAFCGGESRFCSYILHWEWQAATKQGLYHGNLLTFLRHPVERTISEFLFLRTLDGVFCASQPQWDFWNTAWLRAVQNEANTDRALKLFLEMKHTPVRNRQALYLVGWDRDSVRGGMAYDWDRNGTELLEVAKEHLRKTTFGITDCFEASVRLMSDHLGWNASEALGLVRSNPGRRVYAKDHQAQLAFFHGSTVADKLNVNLTEPVSGAFAHSRPAGTWRGDLPEKLVNYLENWNAVDMELYDYARSLFRERYGEVCAEVGPQ